MIILFLDCVFFYCYYEGLRGDRNISAMRGLPEHLGVRSLIYDYFIFRLCFCLLLL